MSLPPLSDWPAPLKACVPFLQRANELASRNRVVSYFCKAYAVQVGIGALPKGDQDATLFLGKLMDELEAEKAQMPPVSDDEARDLVAGIHKHLFISQRIQRPE